MSPKRERVFFIANRMGWPKLRIDKSDTPPIPFGKVRTERGIPYTPGTKTEYYASRIRMGDRDLGDVSKRLNGRESMFNNKILYDDRVVNTVTAGSDMTRFADKQKMSDGDVVNVSSFPQDYDFGDQPVQYLCGMSVPPSLMAHIAHAIREQWLEAGQ